MLSEGRAIPRNPAAARREALAALRHAATRALPRPGVPRRVAARRTPIRWRGGIVTLAMAITLAVAVETHPPSLSARALSEAAQRGAAVVGGSVGSHIHPPAALAAAVGGARDGARTAAADVRARLPAAAPTVRSGAPTSAASAAPRRRLVVANTGGRGVNVRASPGVGQKVLRAWPEGAILVPTGATAQAAGLRWLQVRDPANEVGWVAAAYVSSR